MREIAVWKTDWQKKNRGFDDNFKKEVMNLLPS